MDVSLMTSSQGPGGDQELRVAEAVRFTLRGDGRRFLRKAARADLS